jgi:uracil-DNA glycosylase
MEENVRTSKKVFFDEDETESEEAPEPEANKIILTKSMSRPFLSYIFVNLQYYNFTSWNDFFPDHKVDFYKMLFNPTWNDFFSNPKITKPLSQVEKSLTALMKSSPNKKIVPPPELVFNSFNIVDLSKIKVVILGQDPYQNDKWAMGFSFSIPFGVKTTTSLDNIYKNLMKYGHIKEKPMSGCLAGWVLQGCFMLNASLTTFVNDSNAHRKIWFDFSKQLISQLNDSCTNCVFIAWGADAFKMCDQIDRTKHHVIASSHPSGKSYNKTMTGFHNGKATTYPSFESADHFGLANKYLRENDKGEICWDLLY